MKGEGMDAQVINQIENIITLDLKSDYQFEDGELVKVETLKETFRDQLQALYWILINWVVDEKAYESLPDAGKWFRKNENKAITREKLYTLTRFYIGWVEVAYNKDGMQITRARSTGLAKCNQRQLSDVYDKTYTYFATYIDLTGFEIQHQKAREALGKF